MMEHRKSMQALEGDPRYVNGAVGWCIINLSELRLRIRLQVEARSYTETHVHLENQ